MTDSGHQSGPVTAARGGVTDARVAAADICADLRGGELLDTSFERRVESLDARDRRWTQELLYGMLRRRAWLDAALSERVRGGLARLDPDLTDILRLGISQLLFMRSVPPYAAIAQSVELAKRRHGLGASKLVNAVLRRVDRERDTIPFPPVPRAEPGTTRPDPIDALALTHSHPRWLVARWVARWGAEDTERLLAANNAEAPIIVRPFGVVREQLEAMLESAGVTVGDAPLVSDSLVLTGGVGAMTELGAFKQGLFHLQDPASTLVTRYAAIPAGARVADLCAAPGGKALELARTASVVYAGDASYTRLARVRENVRRLDASNVIPFVGDARFPAVKGMDAVLIDVPCTGTGTFRRHPDSRWRLRVSDLAVLPAVQRSILRAAATAVRPGGLLVYSVCTLTAAESIDLGDAGWPALDPPSSPWRPYGAGARILPQDADTDGMTVLRYRRPA